MAASRNKKHLGAVTRARACFLFCALLTALLCACGQRGEQTSGPPMSVLELAPTDTPPPAITPTPTPAPPVDMRFTADADNPLPAESERVALGSARRLCGEVSCNYPITELSLSIRCAYSDDPRYPYVKSVSFDSASGVYTCALDSENTLEGVSLDSLVLFSELGPGVHTLTLSARCTGAPRATELAKVRFFILGDAWERIRASDFNSTYPEAAAFFGGDKSRFLYRYQWVWKRYIVADPDWEEAYIQYFEGFPESPWKIHVDAVPYYKEALWYVEHTRVRVHGTNGDSGALPLVRLITEYNGSYVSRFTSSLKSISHHAFGTATDLNASMPPNMNNKDNLALIDNEVRLCLAYNGILSDAEGSYYDFTYSGSYACTDFGVPQSVVNYLLYELAFFRAGFQWAHYYNSTSDGMHFTLTDAIDRNAFSKGSRSLRKVFEYDCAYQTK